MINKSDPTLDREDNEAIGEATRHQWDAISHVLHLPALDAMADTPAQTEVRNRIVDLVTRTRGVSINRVLLSSRLDTEFTQERAARAPSTPPGTTARTLEQESLAVAEAWLEVIYRNVDKKDIKQLVSDMPASIRPVNAAGTNEWRVSGVTIEGAPRNIRIDMENPIWQSGTKEQIRARLAGRTIAQAGITVVGSTVSAGYTLDTSPGEIDAILDSTSDVVDPLLPLNGVQITGVNIAGVSCTVSVDLPRLLRDNPTVAGMNSTLLATHLSGLTNDDFRNYVSAVNPADGSEVQVDNTLAGVVTNRLYVELGRTPTQSIASANSSLNDALDSRLPLDSLVDSTADNRELLLALSIYQQDPTTRNALQSSELQGFLDRATLLEREGGLRGAINTLSDDSIKTPTPGRNLAAITVELTTLRNASVPTGVRDATAWSTKNQNDIKELREEYDNLEKVLSAVKQIHSYRASVNTAIPTTGGYIDTFCDPATIAVGAIEAAVTNAGNGFDSKSFANDVQSAFNNTAPTALEKSRRLRDADYYTVELKKAEAEVEKEQGKSLKEGSDAVWEIVRKGLENKGLRGEQLEKTLQYMRNKLQSTPESHKDVEELSRSAYGYEGESNKDAQNEWNEDNQVRTLKTGLLLKNNPYKKYKKRLFSRSGIGYSMGELESARGRSIPLPRLIDAYFRVKYLAEELSADDPRRLPESGEILNLLRTMHSAILERAQLSFSNATEMSDVEQEKVGIKPNMSITERLQAVQSYLNSGKDAYYEKNKKNIERIADRAYAPIKKSLEKRKALKETLKGNGPWYNPLGIPAKSVKFVGGQVVAAVTGNGSVLNPVTYPARTVKGVVANRAPIAKVALLTALGGPIGLGIGLLAFGGEFGKGKNAPPALAA